MAAGYGVSCGENNEMASWHQRRSWLSLAASSVKAGNESKAK